ncbi:MAG: hypothetical protein MUF76_07355 [Hydrogenophaga sp.]|jgi:hypothetical protein|nr:hypothetical protein [Hydrogenophaga sp.]
MNIRGLILRSLIALSMLFGMAGASQAADWVRTNGNVGYVTFEVEQRTLNGVASVPLWQRFMSKVTWGKVATRAAGAGCAVGGAFAFLSDSYAQQRTWWLKGLRVISSCAVGAAAGALVDLTAAALMTAAAPELVTFGLSVAIGAAVGAGAEYLLEKAWAGHTHATGQAQVTATHVTPPRRNLMVYDDEYASVSRTNTFRTNLRHPQSRWVNGTHINTSTSIHVGWDSVGGTPHARYRPAAPC